MALKDERLKRKSSGALTQRKRDQLDNKLSQSPHERRGSGPSEGFQSARSLRPLDVCGRRQGQLGAHKRRERAWKPVRPQRRRCPECARPLPPPRTAGGWSSGHRKEWTRGPRKAGQQAATCHCRLLKLVAGGASFIFNYFPSRQWHGVARLPPYGGQELRKQNVC